MSIFKRFSGNTNKYTKEKKKVSFNLESSYDADETSTTEATKASQESSGSSRSTSDNDGDHSTIWYSLTDQDQFRQRDMKMKNLLHTYSPAEIEIKIGESPRGMEYAYDYEYAVASTTRRHNSIMAVIGTQRIFHRQGYKDCTEAIAIAYDMACDQATSQALQRAKLDEQLWWISHRPNP